MVVTDEPCDDDSRLSSDMNGVLRWFQPGELSVQAFGMVILLDELFESLHVKGFREETPVSSRNPFTGSLASATVAENGSISPQWHHTTADIVEEGRSPTTNRKWLKMYHSSLAVFRLRRS